MSSTIDSIILSLVLIRTTDNEADYNLERQCNILRSVIEVNEQRSSMVSHTTQRPDGVDSMIGGAGEVIRDGGIEDKSSIKTKFAGVTKSTLLPSI